MQVLVVDDSALVRRMVRATLEGAGLVCHEAADGLEAVRLALRNVYVLVVTDIQMPNLDGLKFIQRFRASRKSSGVPILVLSSQRDHATVLRARALGVQGFVLKPVEPEELLERVRAALAHPPE
ncbi:MAG: response regulator [Thermodesulfobacteriota bacterium]